MARSIDYEVPTESMVKMCENPRIIEVEDPHRVLLKKIHWRTYYLECLTMLT